MKLKVHGGTTRAGDPSLCLQCRYAAIVQGASASHQIVHCSRLAARVQFRVASCTEFISRQHPSLFHMEDIAWVLRSDAKRGQIGFVRSRDLPASDRFVFDEE
jgi:hypothetical protein